ncbi:hypothetical protein ACFQE0_15770 [Methylobacterium komagatae]|uniref:Response regulatory domain-containing protein n=1 Tax=Methylobacterium komagatae TaxID=374425 RepID=A0ABW2BKH8_9HYPH
MRKRTGPVLIVDDDAAVRHSLKFALELEGLDVRTYQDGAELLREAALPLRGVWSWITGCPAWTGWNSWASFATAPSISPPF